MGNQTSGADCAVLALSTRLIAGDYRIGRVYSMGNQTSGTDGAVLALSTRLVAGDYRIGKS